MESRFENEHEEEEDYSNAAHSPFSGEEEYAPSPRKKRKGALNKRVITVPIAAADDGGDGSRSRGEVYPPPDKWSWRKYGQKPIKGSPYPRGYYRCSSSKGCPARKQVERSRLDPTTLLITYSCDHNHPLPTIATTAAKNHHPHQHQPKSGSAGIVAPPEESTAAFASQSDIEPAFAELAGDFGWLCNVGSTVMDGTTMLMGPTPWSYTDLEAAAFMPIGEEDKQLFGDLGDLPESSMVFRQVATPCCGGSRR